MSHESLLLAGRRAGIPLHLLSYICTFYRKSNTKLRVAGNESRVIFALQGVKQGDPLSCILFNLIIDWALETLDDDVGFNLDGVTLNHLAFADDVGLLASTPRGLQALIDSFTQHLLKSGLSVNAAKCATLSVAINGKTRKSIIDSTQVFAVGGGQIPALAVVDFYKYLGVQISARGAAPHSRQKLQSSLDALKRAQLKPQQQLWILRSKVLPSLFHELVLSDVSLGYLRWLDVSVRGAVRSWCKLPHDTPKAFFHAKTRDGGLEITSLEFTIPILKQRRLVKL